MVVHSDSNFSAALAFFFLLGSVLACLLSVVQMSLGKFRSGSKTLTIVVAFAIVYVLAVITTSWLSPQRIVEVGDSYCEDVWCIGIENVSVETRGQNKQYDVAVRILSDANRTRISAKGASLYLL